MLEMLHPCQDPDSALSPTSSLNSRILAWSYIYSKFKIQSKQNPGGLFFQFNYIYSFAKTNIDCELDSNWFSAPAVTKLHIPFLPDCFLFSEPDGARTRALFWIYIWCCARQGGPRLGEYLDIYRIFIRSLFWHEVAPPRLPGIINSKSDQSYNKVEMVIRNTTHHHHINWILHKLKHLHYILYGGPRKDETRFEVTNVKIFR